jgi:hypothetical protein
MFSYKINFTLILYFSGGSNVDTVKQGNDITDPP